MANQIGDFVWMVSVIAKIEDEVGNDEYTQKYGHAYNPRNGDFYNNWYIDDDCQKIQPHDLFVLDLKRAKFECARNQAVKVFLSELVTKVFNVQ